MKPFPVHQATAYSVKNILPLGERGGGRFKAWNRCNSRYDENGLYLAHYKKVFHH